MSMHPVIAELLTAGPVVTDGAWGTQLQALGLGLGEFPDAWNLTRPREVMQVARGYVDAGSRVILTNTFGANRIRLAEQGLEGKVEQINRAGVKLSLEAAAGRAKVFASIGPSGKLLMSGDIDADTLAAAFSEQARALAHGGADGLVVETMSDLEEARLAVAAALETGLPVVACMVFDSGKAKDRTMMGQTPEQVAQGLAEAGAHVIGANCGQGIAGFVPLAERLHAASSCPIWIKANAGLPTVEEGKARYHVTPADFAGFVPKLLSAGASFVGGCCGTSPEFIAAVVAALPRA
jgi:5-methyltetrahydrofolate--homocysteine methyltransferase